MKKSANFFSIIVTYPLCAIFKTNFNLYCIFFSVLLLPYPITMISSKYSLSYIQILSIGVTWKWMYLILIKFPFNVNFEQSFWALIKLRTKMRSIAHNNWLNQLILIYVFQEKIIKIGFCNIASKITAGKNSRKERFRIFKFYIIRIDSVFDSG